jgi:putative transposase
MAHTFNLDTYISFLTANGNRYSGVEVAKALLHTDDRPAHDTISRFLAQSAYTPDDLWEHVEKHITLTDALIIDDTVLDKQRSTANELAHVHWSGNAHKMIRGISLVNLLSTDGTTRLPIDYRVYEGAESGITKHDHVHAMLDHAKERGFEPSKIMADCWYASIATMKKIATLGWTFIMGLKENRLVNEVQGQYVPVSDLDWTDHSVRKVWLKGFGWVLVARIVFQNGDTRYVCTNDLSLTDYRDFSHESKKRWSIEEFHRGIKQTTGIEKCYSILKRSQLTHIFASFVAFVRLEVNRLKTGISWYEQKAQLVRMGITRVFA